MQTTRFRFSNSLIYNNNTIIYERNTRGINYRIRVYNDFYKENDIGTLEYKFCRVVKLDNLCMRIRRGTPRQFVKSLTRLLFEKTIKI